MEMQKYMSIFRLNDQPMSKGWTSTPSSREASPHYAQRSCQPCVDRVPEDAGIGRYYETPIPQLSISLDALKGRIRHHYEVASEYYKSLWGEHIHHGYFLNPSDTKERAQVQLIDLLLERGKLPQKSVVLDAGCGIGGTARYLAKEHGYGVMGITISGKQVEMAWQETAKGISRVRGASAKVDRESFVQYPDEGFPGWVRFMELDAEEMCDRLKESTYFGKFDCVWISEALSHLPAKRAFFANAFTLLKPGGKLIIADWFKKEGITEDQVRQDIRPIQDGMLLPQLCTQSEYVNFANLSGFRSFAQPLDISDNVSRTWDISWSLIQNPHLWAFAFSQGRDGIAFLQAFNAMRRGFKNGTFRYAVMVFEKLPVS